MSDTALRSDCRTASLPVWERGLKLLSRDDKGLIGSVAPRVGAWIEMGLPLDRLSPCGCVAPRVGAWIEI